MHGQVRELVTGYGKLDLLWFDFSYDDMAGEKWRASELIEMVRSYQPDVAFVSFGENQAFTYPLPDEKDTVLKIRMKR